MSANMNANTKNETIQPCKRLEGKPRIPGDKSISHRGLIFGALAEGTTEVLDILDSGDVQSTARCLRDLGVKITTDGNITRVEGVGARGFKRPEGVLDCGNSGTTIRLMMGVLAGRGITASMTGDSSLVKRPMKRVAEPLRKMGAQFQLTQDNFAPLTVLGAKLTGIEYDLKVASAQIKSAIILAALAAEGETKITGEIHSRDHTERLLGHFGVKLRATEKYVIVPGGQTLKARRVHVPGGHVVMDNIALNPTRIGFIKALQRMGASISIRETASDPEPVGTIEARYGALKGVHITADEVPSLIDELPMLAVLASQAQGVTLVEGAEELRVKETDRIEAVATNLRAMGIEIEVREDGYRIEGPQKLKGATLQSFHDHRIAMAFSIAGLVAEGTTQIQGADCVGISYPGFYPTLRELTR